MFWGKRFSAILIGLLACFSTVSSHEYQRQFCDGGTGLCSPPSQNNNIIVSPNTRSRQTQSNACPASTCDTTGTLEHHFVDADVGGSVACFAGETTEQNAFLRCFSGDLCSQDREIDAVRFRVRELRSTNVIVSVNRTKDPRTVVRLNKLCPVCIRRLPLPRCKAM